MVHLLQTQKNCTAVDRAELLLQKVCKYHGLHWEINSYRDPKLTVQCWLEFCNVLQIDHHLTTAFHPQANGLAERTNQIMETALIGAAFECRNWFDVLHYVGMAINSASLHRISLSST